MFSSKKLLAGLLALSLAWSPVAAQVPITGAGSASADNSSGTPISNACLNSSGTTITFTAQGVGGAAPNRTTVVSINWSDSTAAGTAILTGMTVGGLTMTRAIRTTSAAASSNSEVWYVANPTGTTANIVASFLTAVDGVTIEVYSLLGYTTVPLAGTTGTTSVSQGYNNRQLAIGAGSRTTNVSTSLSNMVNDYSSACGSSLWGVHSSQRLSGNGGTLTSAISPTSSNPKIALAVWSTQTSNVCIESTAFIARTSGMDATHQNAYGALICGLVADGLFSRFDVLYIHATQTSTIALLNLVSTNFNGTANGSPTFTTDRGFTGVDASTTVYIETGFAPTINGQCCGGNYGQDTAHISSWSNTNATSGAAGGVILGASTGPIRHAEIYPKYNDGNAYFRINSNIADSGQSIANSNSTGHYIANRSASNATQAYRNGSSILTNSNVSTSTPGNNFAGLANRDLGNVGSGGGYQICEQSIGSGLSSADALIFYNRLRTYMTTVGVP